MKLYVVPADRKRVAWLVVAEAIIDALQGEARFSQDSRQSARRAEKRATCPQGGETRLIACAGAASSAKRTPVPYELNAAFAVIRDS
ncbi:MAG: hypothetical protein ABSA68_03800 [Xanthobacteraceae bacterium]